MWKRVCLCLEFAALMAVMVFLTACGGEEASADDGNPDGGRKNESTAVYSAQKQEREWVYVPEVLTLEEQGVDYDDMVLVGDSFCYLSRRGDDESSSQNICRYSLAARELTSIPLRWENDEGDYWESGAYTFGRDYSLWLVANVYSPDYSQLRRFLLKFDAEGENVFAKELGKEMGKGIYINGIAADGQGRIYVFVQDEGISTYDEEGNYHGTIPYDFPENIADVAVKGAALSADGGFYVCVGRGEDYTGDRNAAQDGGIADEITYCILAAVDFENNRFSEVISDFSEIRGLCEGAWAGADPAGAAEPAGKAEGLTEDSEKPQEDSVKSTEAAVQPAGEISMGQSGAAAAQYDFLLYDEKFVYGYQLPGQKDGAGRGREELLYWEDSSINGYAVQSLNVLEDGRLCAIVEDTLNNDKVLMLLTKTKAEEAPQREELTLAAVDAGEALAAIAAGYNRGNVQYHLTVKSYDSLTDLYNAVLAKEPMDIIDLSGINVRRLVAQGFFEDLAPYVERSEAFDESDFVDGLLDAYTFDDTLVGIPASFMLQSVAGDRTLLENKEGLTLRELLDISGRYPGKKSFDGLTKEGMMRYLMMFNEDSFINWESGECRFDSEDFQEVLEFVNSFPDIVEYREEEASMPTKVQSGELLFAVADLRAINAFQLYAEIFGEEAAFVGFPTPDGKGGHILLSSDAFAMAAVSGHKEGAWNFIERFLSEEKTRQYYSQENVFYVSLPTLKRTLNAKVEESIAKGKEIQADKYPTRIFDDGWSFQTHLLTWEEVNRMLELVKDARPDFDEECDEVIKIINEEAPAYYSGQKSAEDVAGVIQNRVKLYVSENMVGR